MNENNHISFMDDPFTYLLLFVVSVLFLSFPLSSMIIFDIAKLAFFYYLLFKYFRLHFDFTQYRKRQSKNVCKRKRSFSFQYMANARDSRNKWIHFFLSSFFFPQIEQYPRAILKSFRFHFITLNQLIRFVIKNCSNSTNK